jgi:hypothetical protein
VWRPALQQPAPFLPTMIPPTWMYSPLSAELSRYGRVRAWAPSLVPWLALCCEEILACEEKSSRLGGGTFTFHSATNDVLHYMPKLSSLL